MTAKSDLRDALDAEAEAALNLAATLSAFSRRCTLDLEVRDKLADYHRAQDRRRAAANECSPAPDSPGSGTGAGS